jgi:hypothetical protein
VALTLASENGTLQSISERNRIRAHFVEIARRAYQDDPDLATLHATKAFTEEQTTTYGLLAEQLEAEAATKVAEVAEAVATMEVEKARAEATTTMADIQAKLMESRTKLAAAGAVMAAASTADNIIHAGSLGRLRVTRS